MIFAPMMIRWRPWRGVIEEYREHLPVDGATPVVTLLEGGTPLVRSGPLSEETGCKVWLKVEGANPTGSFKDRGMTVAVSKAVQAGARAVICASTGNTSASAAAYAARAGLTCAVLAPEGGVALGKIAQAVAHGARILTIRGSFDAAFDAARTVAERHAVTLVNSVNPDRIQGQKTLAFEVCDALRKAPDLHLVPVGNAGNITSHWLGYRQYRHANFSRSLPRMFGFQAAGAAPIVLGHVVEHPETVASAIRIGNPASWKEAEEAARDSGGEIRSVTDDEILAAYRRVAAEGVFCEPASAASVAGLLQLSAAGALEPGATVVCVLTGNGLKDPETAMTLASQAHVIDPDPDQVAAALGLA